MKETLYELTAQMRAIEETLDETGGELTPELEEMWNETGESLAQKVDNYNSLINHLDNYSENLAKEIKRLQALKKTADNSLKRIKAHIMDTMQQFGLTKLDGALCKVTLSSTTATEVDDEVVLAPYLARLERLMLPPWITAELKISKSLLKDSFKDADVTPAGVRFVKNPQLRIR